MKKDLEGLGVGSHDDELADATVEGLGGLIGTLAELLVVARLLDEVKDLLAELSLGEGVSLGVNLLIFCGHFFFFKVI